jgi:hypothetical protein
MATVHPAATGTVDASRVRSALIVAFWWIVVELIFLTPAVVFVLAVALIDHVLGG